MPRVARLWAPNTFRHVTAHIANSEFRLDTPGAREEYLVRLAQQARRSDVRLLSYAIMSNHVHLGLEVGEGNVSLFMQRLQGGFGRWLNKRQGRSGYVWRGRYFDVVGDDAQFAAHFITYHHNNPVRAGVVDAAADSNWTSHRAYGGAARRIDELDVERGLELCGCADTAAGRAAFDALTLSRVAVSACPWMSEEWIDRVRRRARQLSQAPIEVGQPVVSTVRDEDGRSNEALVEVPIVIADATAAAFRGAPDVDALVRAAAAMFGATEWSLRGRHGSWRTQMMRRAMAWAWTRRIGGRPIDLGRALNRSRSAISQWLRKLDADSADAEARRLGDQLAEKLLAGDAVSGT